MFDIIIMGGGHAGVEASWIASSFAHLKVGLVTMPGVPIGSTPCNPAVGGVGKGQVVREIDALGGLMGRLADLSGLQYRILNESKGYAVQSTRVQVDKELYPENALRCLRERSNLTILEAQVLKVSQRAECGFTLDLIEHEQLETRSLIVTTGTFLSGKLHTGESMLTGGRHQSQASAGLVELFANVKTLPKRFKTGTPPRLDARTIDFTELEEQPSDDRALNFHFSHAQGRIRKQRSCFFTRTTRECLDLIRANKDRSPMYNGQISAVGPRYCPSIEDKAFRYPDRHEHHVFLEPETIEGVSIYPNGLSTSLPLDIQESFLKLVPGLEKAQILIPGYAVEYDVVDTTFLDHFLSYKDIKGLYFAGQVNGTSGYEEAAAQGLVAGLNCALTIQGEAPIKFDRNESYIGVLIDDLVTMSRDEPYRLFTARSENRLYIREDNTYLRMAPTRLSLGLNDPIDMYLKSFMTEFELLWRLCSDYRTKNSSKFPHELSDYTHAQLLDEYLGRGKVDPVLFLDKTLQLIGARFRPEVVRAVAISKKYGGYIQRASDEYTRLGKLGRKRIQWRSLMDYHNISFECKQRIEQFRPETFDQLQKIEGIRPATLVFVSGMIS